MKARLFTREKRIREVQRLERCLFSIEDERGAFVQEYHLRKERHIVPFILGHNVIGDVKSGTTTPENKRARRLLREI